MAMEELSQYAEAAKDGVGMTVDMNTGDSETVTQDPTVVQENKPARKDARRQSFAEELQEHYNKEIEKEEAALAVPKRQKEIKNPDARNRRLEKERDGLKDELAIRDQQIRDLQIAMERLHQDSYERYMQSQMQGLGEEDAIDPEIDPVGAMQAEIAKLRMQAENDKKERELRDQYARQEQMVRHADALIAQKAAQNPQEFKAAMDHLAGVVYEHANNTMGHLTSMERKQTVEAWVKQQKAQWIASNINPADALLSLAREYGFEGNGHHAQELLEPEDDNRAAIQRSRRRTQNTANLGGVAGVAPSNFNAESLMNKSSAEFNRTIDNLIASGKVKGGKGGKTPSLLDLIPEKAVRV